MFWFSFLSISLFFNIFLFLFHFVSSRDFEINNLSNTISSNLQEILFKYQLNSIGALINMRSAFNSKDVDLEISTALKLENSNSEIGMDGHRIQSVYIDGKEIKDESIYINYLYDQGIFPSNQSHLVNSTPSIDKKNNAYIQCNYTFTFPQYYQMYIPLSKYYFHIVQSGRYIYGKSAGYLISIIDYKNKDHKSWVIPLESRNHIEVINNTVSDNAIQGYVQNLDSVFSVHSAFDRKNDKSYIITFLYNNTLMIFDVVTLKSTSDIKTYSVLIGVMKTAIYSTMTIYDVSIDKDLIYLSSSMSTGINIYKLSDFSYISNYQYNSLKFDYILVNNKTVYGLSKGFGLVIFDLETHSVRNIFDHPNMLSMHFYSNPFSGAKFVGIFFDHEQTRNEFYMELFLHNEQSPTINKIFSSTDNDCIIKSMIIVDSFFLYFYNSAKHVIYSTRKGILNKISTLIYSFNLLKNNNTGISLIPYFNRDTLAAEPALTFSQQILVLTNVSYPNQTLNCTFKKPGKISLILDRVTDVCGQGISIYDSSLICDKGYYFDLECYDNYKYGASSKVVVIVIASLAVAGLIAFFIFWKYYQFLGKNRYKLITVDKADRKNIYMALEETEPSGNINIQLSNVNEEPEQKVQVQESAQKATQENGEKTTGGDLIPPDSKRSDALSSVNEVFIHNGKNKDNRNITGSIKDKNMMYYFQKKK